MVLQESAKCDSRRMTELKFMQERLNEGLCTAEGVVMQEKSKECEKRSRMHARMAWNDGQKWRKPGVDRGSEMVLCT